MLMLLIPLRALYKKVTSATNLLFFSDIKFSFFKRVSVFKMNLVALLCTFSTFSIFFLVKGDNTTQQYSTFDRTNAQSCLAVMSTLFGNWARTFPFPSFPHFSGISSVTCSCSSTRHLFCHCSFWY